MADTLTAEELAQRIIDVNVLDHRQVQSVFGDFGSHNISVNDFQQGLLRRGLLTNYQLNRLIAGHRDGYFYGKYKVLYGVGAGTFARVYRSVDPATGKIYAVKVLRRSLSNERESQEVRDTIQSFRREGELGLTLKHPNIVPIHEVYSKGLIHYIVMDFVEGNNLREFFKIRKHFEPLEATRIVADIASGLSYAHQKGVTHRDLKMSNALLSADGTAQLVDFGLAALDKATSDAELDKTANSRTIDYAGLERATNVQRGDPRSDIYFAGCIYYQLLSGKPPMVETRERMQRLAKGRYQDIPPIREVAPDVPPALAMIVNKAIEFDPEKRYQTAGEFLVDLKLMLKRIESTGSVEEETNSHEPTLEGHDESGRPRSLLVVESDVKMQNVFRELFKKRGYRVLVTSDPDRALQRLQEEPDAADLAVMSAGAIGPRVVEVFKEFASNPATKDLPAVLLLGPQQKDLTPNVESESHRAVAQMPVKARELRKIVQGLLSVEA